MKNIQPSSPGTSVTEKNFLFRSLVGKSPAMHAVRRDIEQVACSDANVLILGESGTGKEIVARNIHYHSNRRDAAFVPVNCGAIPHELLESELFGHEKGAFTGAITARLGRFAMAEGGTLFLDEIGEMTMAMQVKLLRVLEERVFERVGGSSTIQADVRIIAATNRDLESMVKHGKFREDLYFRLDVFPIRLPALRHRIEDLPLLVNEMVSRLEHSGGNRVRFSTDAIHAMSQYDWPGNVRELANQIERMAIRHPGGLVQSQDLPGRITGTTDSTGQERIPAGHVTSTVADHDNARRRYPDLPDVHIPDEGLDLKTYISSIEISIIIDALNSTGGVIAHAARLLGLQRTTLAEKIRKYHIDRHSNAA